MATLPICLADAFAPRVTAVGRRPTGNPLVARLTIRYRRMVVHAPSDAFARFEAMLSDRPRRRLRRHSVVHHEGDPPGDAAYIHDGLVKLVRDGADGHSALVGFRGARELLGEHSALDAGPRMTTAVVVTAATVTKIDRDLLRSTVRADPDLALYLLSTVVADLRETTRHVLDLASTDQTARVAKCLHDLASERRFASIRSVTGDDISIDMPIAHEELAIWAGVSQRSADTALKFLRDSGTITTGRMRIDILDPAALDHRSRERRSGRR